MTYKAINGKASDYISAMFRYVSDVHLSEQRDRHVTMILYTIQGQTECLGIYTIQVLSGITYLPK